MMAILQIHMNLVGYVFYYYADTGDSEPLILFTLPILVHVLICDIPYIVYLAKLNFVLVALNKVALGLLIGTNSHIYSVSIDRVRNAYYNDLRFVSDLHTNNNPAIIPEPHQPCQGNTPTPTTTYNPVGVFPLRTKHSNNDRIPVIVLK
jgi:hypothetical protein